MYLLMKFTRLYWMLTRTGEYQKEGIKYNNVIKKYKTDSL